MTTHLSEDQDPDTPASEAMLELEAPTVEGERLQQGSKVQLRFREVWWAQSFGLQPLGETIRWARVQFAEQVRHILIPVGSKLGPARTALRAPARQTPQALTYRPDTAGTPQPATSGGSRHALLHAALAVYAVVQYIWKLVQWLTLTPLLFLLLFLMGILRTLSFIGVIRSALVASFTALTSYVMLHWIASTQVYMRDYTRATAIRQRFEREVDAFLHDPQCERVVVLAHSMGTVIAYEGLTTLLSVPEPQQGDKPITFICLAQALRRIWLLPGIDTQRLRGVLPERVRWLNFWARYDPVPAGPLSARSLPSQDAWAGESVAEHYQALCASLDRCENVDVVNTDSSLTDHVNYWMNVEQVVGPIARELVTGHPAMEHLVQTQLATPDDVLRRRWNVAWRYSLGLVVGLAAGVGVVVLAAVHPEIGQTVAAFLQQIQWGDIITSVCPVCKPLLNLPLPTPPERLTSQQLAHYFALFYFIRQYLTLGTFAVGVLAIGAAAAGMQIIGQAVSRPSPYAFPRLSQAEQGGARSVYFLSALTLALALVTSLLFSTYVRTRVVVGASAQNQVITVFLLSLSAAEVVSGIAFWVGVFRMVANRQWTWIIAIFICVLLTFMFDPYYRSALLAITVVGCLVMLLRLARTHESVWYWALALQLVIILYIGVGSLLADTGLASIGSLGSGAYVEPVLPVFLYGIWSGAAGRGTGPAPVSKPRGLIVGLSAVYLVMVYVLVVGLYGTVLVIFPNRPVDPAQQLHKTAASLGTLTLGDPKVVVAVLVALTALALALIDAVRGHRWVWIAAMPLITGALGTIFVLLRVDRMISPIIPDDALLLSFLLIATALMYVLWAGPGYRKQPKSGT